MKTKQLLSALLIVAVVSFAANQASYAQTVEKTTKKTEFSTQKKQGTTPSSVKTTSDKAVTKTTPATPAKPAVASKDITGYWLTAQKATIVEFYKAGDKYNGKIVWSKQKDKKGQPLKDVNNPDKTKRSKPLVGQDIITGLTYNPKTGQYEGGRIYQPQTGKSFNGKVKLDKSSKTMQVTGGAGFISKTLTWTRTTGVPGK